jgi:hypothetical protein
MLAGRGSGELFFGVGEEKVWAARVVCGGAMHQQLSVRLRHYSGRGPCDGR